MPSGLRPAPQRSSIYADGHIETGVPNAASTCLKATASPATVNPSKYISDAAVGGVCGVVLKTPPVRVSRKLIEQISTKEKFTMGLLRKIEAAVLCDCNVVLFPREQFVANRPEETQCASAEQD